MKIRKLNGLTKKLILLLQEQEDLFFEERPFLESGGEPIIKNQIERRSEVELKIKKCQQTICQEMDILFPKEIPDEKQTKFL